MPFRLGIDNAVFRTTGDLEQKMDSSERSVIAGVKAKVQELHDAWFEGIMGRKR